jgi:hypothetical protein
MGCARLRHSVIFRLCLVPRFRVSPLCFGSHCRKCSLVHSRWPSHPEGNCLEEERAKSGGELGVLARIRGGCVLEGELRLQDVLSDKLEWDRLCQVGMKVEAALGVRAEAEPKLLFSP